MNIPIGDQRKMIPMFNIGSEYTRDEIHQHLGGSKQSYLPTVAGHVVAVCVTPKLNPRAPHVVLCGVGPVISASGAMLAKQPGPVPIFIKRAINRWEYQGPFNVSAAHSSGSRFDALISESGRRQTDVSLAIELA